MNTGDIILSIFLPLLVISVLFIVNWFIYGSSEEDILTEIEAKIGPKLLEELEKLEELEELEKCREIANVLIAIQNAHEDTMSKSSFSRLTGVEEWLKDEAKKHFYYV